MKGFRPTGDKLADLRSQNYRLRDQLSVARANAEHWERTAHRVRASLEAQRETHEALVSQLNQTIRELVGTIAKYPDSLADILNPRMEVKETVGMDSIGFDDALGQPVGMYPAFEDDVPTVSNGRGEIKAEDEEWHGT